MIAKRILGIDPGTNVLGFAVIDADKKNIEVVEMGAVTFRHISDEQADKLRYIFEQVQDLIRQYKPAEMAIEAPFYGKNVQSMLKLGRAQGVAIAAAMVNQISINEYAPRRIKQAVTGKGNASKEQVSGMLAQLCSGALQLTSLDASDALATAVCHWYSTSRTAVGGKKYRDWGGFIKQNPDRKI